MSNSILISRATLQDYEPALELAWKTFLKFEADQYGEEGTKNFRDFLVSKDLRKMFIRGEYPIFVAKDEKGAYIGVISVRNRGHISLLFVEDTFHRKGIGRMLMDAMQEFVKNEFGVECMTVNAAPYAIPFYHKVGFTDIGPQMTTDGIIYTPMEKLIV